MVNLLTLYYIYTMAPIPCTCKKKLSKCDGNCDTGGQRSKVSVRDTDDKTKPHCECGYGSCICRTKYRKNKIDDKIDDKLEQEQRKANSQIGRLLESLQC